MAEYYTGLVKKKYTLFCVAPDGAKAELAICYQEDAAQTAKTACESILHLMAESFDDIDAFAVEIATSMEADDAIPLVEHKKT